MNILMTGCSTGFGKSVYKHWVQDGFRVWGVGINGPDQGCDFRHLSSDNSYDEIINAARDYFLDEPNGYGHIDALINNAGMTYIEKFQEYDPYKLDDLYHVNLKAPMMLAKSVIINNYERGPSTKKTTILNTSSMGTQMGLRMSPGYVATKAGLEAFTKTLSKELTGQLPVKVLCIAPNGIEDTAMAEDVIQALIKVRGMTEEQARAYAVQSPLGRNISHEDMIKMFDFALFSPEHMTGSVIYMPGGIGV